MKEMNIKFISVAVLFIILILILSEINNIKTKQQLQIIDIRQKKGLSIPNENF